MRIPLPLAPGQYRHQLDQDQALSQQTAMNQQKMQMLQQLAPHQIQALEDAHNKATSTAMFKKILMQHIMGTASASHPGTQPVAQPDVQAPPTLPPTDIRAPGVQMPSIVQPQPQQNIQAPQQQVPQQSQAEPDQSTTQSSYSKLLSNPNIQMMAAMSGITLPKPFESLQDKLNQSVATAKARATATQEARGGNIPTRTMASNMQGTIQATKNLLPKIDDLINGKNVYGITDFMDWDKKAKYDADTKMMADQMVTAYRLPKTDASLKMVLSQVKRHFMEDIPAYEERMKALKSDLIRRYGIAKHAIDTHKISTESPDVQPGNNDLSSLSNEELQKIAQGGK